MKSTFDMHYNASAEIQEKAKALRKDETKAEKLLWQQLKSKQILGYKFRRQHPISQFIVDFYCHELKLVIEVDGEIHNKPENKEYDVDRGYELEMFGLKILRFTNYEVENEMEKKVIERIKNFVTELKKTP